MKKWVTICIFNLFLSAAGAQSVPSTRHSYHTNIYLTCLQLHAEDYVKDHHSESKKSPQVIYVLDDPLISKALPPRDGTTPIIFLDSLGVLQMTKKSKNLTFTKFSPMKIINDSLRIDLEEFYASLDQQGLPRLKNLGRSSFLLVFDCSQKSYGVQILNHE